MAGTRKPPKQVPGSSPLPCPRTAARIRWLHFRVTPEEEAQIQAQARAHGRGVATYLRDLALDESFRRAHARYVGHLAAKLAGFPRRFTRMGEEV